MRAVVFDLFETLVTEWGHEKYTKRQLTSDLHCPYEEFTTLWEALHEQQYRGEITFLHSLQQVCGQLSIPLTADTIAFVTARRRETKAACFDPAYIHPDVLPLLRALKAQGIRVAILSNCSEEEVSVLRSSQLASLADEIILSCDVGLCKPDPQIYRLTAQRLQVTCGECLYIGDGGSRELYGAAEAGMHPFRAMWYIRQMPSPIREQAEFHTLDNPADVLRLLTE